LSRKAEGINPGIIFKNMGSNNVPPGIKKIASEGIDRMMSIS
jgi:hypothetical protein